MLQFITEFYIYYLLLGRESNYYTHFVKGRTETQRLVSDLSQVKGLVIGFGGTKSQAFIFQSRACFGTAKCPGSADKIGGLSGFPM